MKILLLKPFLLSTSNGGEISLIERLKLLKARGWEVVVRIAVPASSREFSEKFLMERGTPLQGDHYTVKGLRCEVCFREDFHPVELEFQKPMEAYFQEQIDQVSPDFVVAHYTDFFATTAAVKWNPERAMILQTDDEYPRLDRLAAFPTVLETYKQIQNFVVASRFMQRSVRENFPGTNVLYLPNPIAELSELPKLESQDYWLFVNPVPVKGVEFMLQLAQALPNEKFLFVGNWTDECPKDLSSNIEWKPRQPSIYPLFAHAKGLLMPSVWNEAFGRLCLEAMQMGLPVIASDRGALPDTVSSGGQVLPLDEMLWKKALSEFSPDWFQEWGQKGEARYLNYRAETERRYDSLLRLTGK